MYLPQSGGRSSGHYKDAVTTSQAPVQAMLTMKGNIVAEAQQPTE
jgi:hypothetical protein